MVALSPSNKALAKILNEISAEQTQAGTARPLSLQLDEFESCR